jgi:hypothetical protein
MNTRARLAVGGTALAGLLALTAASCEDTGAQSTGQTETEEAYAQQRAAVPYPKDQLKDSLERRNLSERLLRTNDPTKIGYVYLFLNGADAPIGYYVIKGKVSNTDSQMTTDQLITNKYSGGTHMVVNAPGDDGTYGPNESGNFFFTQEGTFVETDLVYLYADQPLPIDVPRLNEKK